MRASPPALPIASGRAGRKIISLAVLNCLVIISTLFASEKIAVDGARAYQHVADLVALGPRPPGSAAIKRARGYILGVLQKEGVRIRQYSFLGDTPFGQLPMMNLVAEIPGKSNDVILIGSHYDTKYFKDFRFVGANDGGSSSGLLLELARALNKRKGDYTFWLVFFDGEEALIDWTEKDSLYGSRYLVKRLKESGELDRIKAVIVLDMVGDKDLQIKRASPATSWLNEIIWETAARMGYGNIFLKEEIALEDDHTPFLMAGVPATTIIDFDYGGKGPGELYWHTPQDTLDKISARSLGIVGNVLLQSLARIEKALKSR